MNSNLKIKVVKKLEIKPVVAKKIKGNTARLAAREMVSTVTDWVTEFKQRKSEETKAAIDKFITRQPQTSEL
jgi:uncharacterized membrane-anchored protein